MSPCSCGDGFYCVDEADLAANHGDSLIGRAVGGRFVVLGLLGSGSMAKVYRAQELETQRPAALKIFRARDVVDASGNPRASTAESQERFLREAQILERLDHPNCIAMLDSGADDGLGVLYIALELVGGQSLRRAMNRGLKLDAILAIVDQVLAALEEAHELDIVHRDLKPENIIVVFRGDEPTVKVVDFGIARLLGHDRVADKALVGALFGTPAYMSPEQCRGEVDAVGPQSDIYSLGCVMYEMICGRLPFEARLPQQMLRMHTDAPIPEITPRPALEVDPALRAIVAQCLSKTPGERFENARDLRLALSSIWRPTPTDLAAVSAQRVVVPQNQISGVDIQLPPELRSAVAGASIPTRPQTSRADPTGGISQAELPIEKTERGALMVFAALFVVTIVCVVIFYAIWHSLT